MLREDLKNLSTEEKLDLVRELWDSIEEDTATSLSPAQKKIIREGEKMAKDSNAKLMTWDDIIANVRKAKKK